MILAFPWGLTSFVSIRIRPGITRSSYTTRILTIWAQPGRFVGVTEPLKAEYSNPQNLSTLLEFHGYSDPVIMIMLNLKNNRQQKVNTY